MSVQLSVADKLTAPDLTIAGTELKAADVLLALSASKGWSVEYISGSRTGKARVGNLTGRNLMLLASGVSTETIANKPARRTDFEDGSFRLYWPHNRSRMVLTPPA
jgi:hypothetical protein